MTHNHANITFIEKLIEPSLSLLEVLIDQYDTLLKEEGISDAILEKVSLKMEEFIESDDFFSGMEELL